MWQMVNWFFWRLPSVTCVQDAWRALLQYARIYHDGWMALPPSLREKGSFLLFSRHWHWICSFGQEKKLSSVKKVQQYLPPHPPPPPPPPASTASENIRVYTRQGATGHTYVYSYIRVQYNTHTGFDCMTVWEHFLLVQYIMPLSSSSYAGKAEKKYQDAHPCVKRPIAALACFAFVRSPCFTFASPFLLKTISWKGREMKSWRVSVWRLLLLLLLLSPCTHPPLSLGCIHFNNNLWWLYVMQEMPHFDPLSLLSTLVRIVLLNLASRETLICTQWSHFLSFLYHCTSASIIYYIMNKFCTDPPSNLCCSLFLSSLDAIMGRCIIRLTHSQWRLLSTIKPSFHPHQFVTRLITWQRRTMRHNV